MAKKLIKKSTPANPCSPDMLCAKVSGGMCPHNRKGSCFADVDDAWARQRPIPWYSAFCAACTSVFPYHEGGCRGIFPKDRAKCKILSAVAERIQTFSKKGTSINTKNTFEMFQEDALKLAKVWAEFKDDSVYKTLFSHAGDKQCRKVKSRKK